jgi:hypothetical protein
MITPHSPAKAAAMKRMIQKERCIPGNASPVRLVAVDPNEKLTCLKWLEASQPTA